MTDINLIQQLKESFGGYVIKYDLQKVNPNYLQQACWRLRITEGRKLIVRLLPFVRVKQEQLMLALVMDYLNQKRSPTTKPAKDHIYELLRYSKHIRLRDEGLKLK